MKKVLYLIILVNYIFADDGFVRDKEKEVILDNRTNLMWQDNNESKGIAKKWPDAMKYCKNLILGGYKDWYLPDYNQLKELSNRNKYNPSISKVFKNVTSSRYWSSSCDKSKAWAVGFGYGGFDSWSDKSYNYYVRCVRDNNSN